MQRMVIGMIIGLVAGIIDIVPMIIKKLDGFFILSALCMWIVVGICASYIRFFSYGWANGLIVSILIFIPLSFLIYKLDPKALPQIIATTLVLGSLVGFFIGKFA